MAVPYLEKLSHTAGFVVFNINIFCSESVSVFTACYSVTLFIYCFV